MSTLFEQAITASKISSLDAQRRNLTKDDHNADASNFRSTSSYNQDKK